MLITDKNFFFNGKLTRMGKIAMASGTFAPKYYAIGDSEANYSNSNLPAITLPVVNTSTFKSFLTSSGCDPFNVLNITTKECCYVNKIGKKYFSDIEPLLQGTLTKSQINGTSVIDLSATTPLNGTNMLEITFTNANGISTTILYRINAVWPMTVTLLDKALPSTSYDFVTATFKVYSCNDVDYLVSNFDTNFDMSCGSYFKNCEENYFKVFDFSIYYCNGEIGFNDCELDKWGNTNFSGLLNKIGLGDYCAACSSGSTVCEDVVYDKSSQYGNKVGIIHYSNPSLDDLGGDYFWLSNNDILTIELPNVTWFTGSGSTLLIASGGTVTDCGEIYVPVYVGTRVVGRVLPNLKMIVITDGELLNLMSPHGNRAYAMPQLSGRLTAATSTGYLLQPNEILYFTYVLETNGKSYQVPQGNIRVIENLTTKPKNVELYFSQEDGFVNMIADRWYANKFKVLLQIVQKGEIPASDAWKELDYTTLNLTNGIVGGKINPQLLELQICRPTTTQYSTAPTYLANIENLSSFVDCQCYPLNQTFPFMGNIDYKMGKCNYIAIYPIMINGNTLTSNRVSDKDIAITEIGLFDSDKNLLLEYKVKQPIIIKPENKFLLELSMDF